MTTLAYRDGVLATDSVVSGQGTAWGTVRKAIALPAAGVLAAACGPADWASRFLDWVNDLDIAQHKGARPPTLPPQMDLKTEDMEGWYIRPLHGLGAPPEIWLFSGGSTFWRLNAKFIAGGSGARFAMGAMHMGATATEAVTAAIQFDVYSAAPVQALSLSPSGPVEVRT